MTNTKLKNTDFKRNLPASILKGAAANLAIQAIGKNLNKKNLLPTLAFGALGGGLSYLSNDKYLSTLIATSIFAGGNALINKTSIPKTLAKYAAIGTAARLMLNIPEAVAKFKEVSDKIKWETIKDYKLPKGDLPFVEQADPNVGCTQATLESIATYLNKPIIFTDYSQGYDFYDYAANKNQFNVKTIYNKDYSHTKDIQKISQLCYAVGSYINNGCPAAATYFNGYFNHTVGIMGIKIQRKNVNGTYKYRYSIRIMNPSDKMDEAMQTSDFANSVIRIVKP